MVLLTCLLTSGPINTKPEKTENCRTSNITVRPTVHTNPPRKVKEAVRKRSSNGWIINDGLIYISVLVSTENSLKTKLFKNDDCTIIAWFPSQSFSQTQLQNYLWLLPLQFIWRTLWFCRVKTPISNSLAHSMDEARVEFLIQWWSIQGAHPVALTLCIHIQVKFRKKHRVLIR